MPQLKNFTHMNPRIMIRWWLAFGCSFYSVKLMIKGLHLEGFLAAPFLIFSFVLVISAVLLIAPETAFKLAEAFSRPFTGIFFPDEKFSKPPLSYLLARRYRLEMRTADAISEYANIIHYYPQEREAYLELISLAKSTGHEKIYGKYSRKFQRRFHSSLSAPTRGG